MNEVGPVPGPTKVWWHSEIPRRPHLLGSYQEVKPMQRTLASQLAQVPPGETAKVEGWIHRRRALAAVTFVVPLLVLPAVIPPAVRTWGHNASLRASH